jgi:hypothetical protein
MVMGSSPCHAWVEEEECAEQREKKTKEKTKVN